MTFFLADFKQNATKKDTKRIQRTVSHIILIVVCPELLQATTCLLKSCSGFFMSFWWCKRFELI